MLGHLPCETSDRSVEKRATILSSPDTKQNDANDYLCYVLSQITHTWLPSERRFIISVSG